MSDTMSPGRRPAVKVRLFVEVLLLVAAAFVVCTLVLFGFRNLTSRLESLFEDEGEKLALHGGILNDQNAYHVSRRTMSSRLALTLRAKASVLPPA